MELTNQISFQRSLVRKLKKMVFEVESPWLVSISGCIQMSARAAETERASALWQLKKLWKRKIFIIHWPLWLSGISCLFTWYKATKLIREPGKHSIIPMCQLSQPNYSSVHFTIENLFHYMLSESQKNKKYIGLVLRKHIYVKGWSQLYSQFNS